MPLPDPPAVPTAPSPRPAPTERGTGLSRRRVLGAAVTSAGVAAFGKAFGQALGQGTARGRAAATQPATPAPAAIGASFVEPPVLRSQNGRLDVALSARYGPATIGDRTVTTFTYNGHVPGPTLRLRPGETLGLTLANDLDKPTNIHTHGLHVSPAGISDNVFRHLMPGETVPYRFDLPPDRASGLYAPGFYWYHPHIHGNSAEQVEGGMAGVLIVEGGIDDLPEIRDLPERLLVLQAAQFGADGTLSTSSAPDAFDFFVNGQSVPTLAIAPGETQRWRILNASSFRFVNLALDGHQLHQIASDANPLREVWTRDEIVMAPGERVEVLVQGGPAGDYALHSLPWGEDLEFQAQIDRPLATLSSTGPAVAPRPLPTTLVHFDDLRLAPIDRFRDVVFSHLLNPFRPQIDGHSFDENRVDQTVRLGTTEEWRLRNTSGDWHPFHIHVNDFQVISVNGEPVDAHSLEDTRPIPAMGEIVIRTRFLDFPGKFVYHCHILDHEDLGMMGVVEVVE